MYVNILFIQVIDPESFNGLPDKLINELKASSHFLRYTEDARTKSTIYNFPLKELSTSDLREHLKLILSNLPCAAKVNFAFGFVLRDITEDVYRYHHAADNSTVFEKPFVLFSIVNFSFVVRTDGLNLHTKSFGTSQFESI